MTDFKKIFIDTAPIIYYLQKNELYYDTIRCFWQKHEFATYLTSTITLTEYLIYPYRQKNIKLIQNFFSFIENMDIEIIDIDTDIAKKAALIRAEYPFFKTMDSLQLATACCSGCDLFLTNDKQLRQFTEIKCKLLAE